MGGAAAEDPPSRWEEVPKANTVWMEDWSGRAENPDGTENTGKDIGVSDPGISSHCTYAIGAPRSESLKVSIILKVWPATAPPRSEEARTRTTPHNHSMRGPAPHRNFLYLGPHPHRTMENVGPH